MPDKQILSQISNEDIFNSIMENAPLLISAKDLDGNVIMANKRFELLEGYNETNFVGRNVYDLFPHDIADQLWKNDLAALEGNEQVIAEETVKHKDGTSHTYHTVKFPLCNQQGEACAVCAISYDITDVKHAEKRSYEDDLTKLYNRRFFNQAFNEELNRARRANLVFGLMLLDLDRFKHYNDSFGHEKGDEALYLFAKALKNACHRASDFCFRIGGEEFAVLCTAEQPDKVQELGEKIRQEVEELEIAHELNTPYRTMTCSIGITSCGALTDTPSQSQLYSLADKALYAAKDAGRNTVRAIHFAGN